jgi:DNA primase
MLSGYAGTIHLLFDPDAAGEKAVERAAATAAELKLDLRVLRLPDDPADWLLEHTTEEFRALLSDAVPVFEYVFRRKAGSARGASAAERSRILSEVKGLVREIEDPVFQRDAVRLAAEALGVGPSALYTAKSPPAGVLPRESRREEPQRTPRDPLIEAGRELLALMVARPDLAARPLGEGVGAPALQRPLVLEDADFGDDAQANVFALLREHAGEDLGAVFSDERARPLLDEIGALQAAGEKLYPSDTSLRATWLRVGALSRERAKALADDLDEKFRLHGEIKRLNRAAVEIGDLTLES